MERRRRKKSSTQRDLNPQPFKLLLPMRLLYCCATTAVLGVCCVRANILLGKKMSSMSYFQSRSGVVSPPVKTTRTSSLDQQLVRIPFIDVVSNFYHFGITRVTILPFSAPQMSCIFSICETNSDICRIRLDFNVSTEWKDPWWWSSGRQVCLKIGMSWV